MTESGQSAETDADSKHELGQQHIAAAREFVAEHGSPARGIVQAIGRSGARVVLVGGDGAMGDVVVPSMAAGEALVEEVDDLTKATWDAETVNATQIGPEHRRKMGISLTRG